MKNIIKNVVQAIDINMGGLLLKQAIPTRVIDQRDPFILLHHGTLKYTDKAPALQQGVGPHPHRGFSPVTFVIEGEMHHRDSFGHNQVAKKEEVQWMHAGAGITHSERPTSALVEKNGSSEIIQLWVNSPAKSKMKPPTYQYLSKDNITIFHSEDGNVENKLIAGKYNSAESKIKTESELLILWSKSLKGGKNLIRIPDGYDASIFVIKGSIKINENEAINGENLILLEKGTQEITVSSEEGSQYLLLSGVPIDEKVEAQGPFVMNNTTEIMEAYRDYRQGKMGVLIEDF